MKDLLEVHALDGQGNLKEVLISLCLVQFCLHDDLSNNSLPSASSSKISKKLGGLITYSRLVHPLKESYLVQHIEVAVTAIEDDLKMILMETLCKSDTVKPSLTSSTLLIAYLVVHLGGKLYTAITSGPIFLF